MVIMNQFINGGHHLGGLVGMARTDGSPFGGDGNVAICGVVLLRANSS